MVYRRTLRALTVHNRVETVEAPSGALSGSHGRGTAVTGERTPIICNGIAALAVYVQTVDGMKWRCQRCGAAVKVVT